MSPTSHKRLPQTEIDDLISLGYVFIELSGGSLEWYDKPVDDILKFKNDWDAVEVSGSGDPRTF